MAFASAAYAVVARVFELLDSFGFVRIRFGRFTLPVPVPGDYYGFEYNDPAYTGADSAAIGFEDSAAPNVLITATDDAGARSIVQAESDNVRLRSVDSALTTNAAISIIGFTKLVDIDAQDIRLDADPTFGIVRATADSIELLPSTSLLVNGQDLWGVARLTAQPTLAVTLVGAGVTPLANTVVVPDAPYDRLAIVQVQNLFNVTVVGRHDYYVTISGGIALSVRTRWDITTATSGQSSTLSTSVVIPANSGGITVEVGIARVSAACNISTSGSSDLNRLEVLTQRMTI